MTKVEEELRAGPCEDNQGRPGFEFEGMWIVNPFWDETGRFSVGPDYYGEEGLKLCKSLGIEV